MKKETIISFVILLLLVAGTWYLVHKNQNLPVPVQINQEQPSSTTTTSDTNLSGTYVCLPHTDTTGPQTMECALGLKADDGTYYALNFSPMTMTPPIVTGDHISITGKLTPIANLNTDQWQKYPIVGIFSVTSYVKK